MGDILTNSKARRDYHVLDTLEAGIVLQGTEVKSLRGGKGQLRDAYVMIENGEAFLHNSHISEYAQGNLQNHNPKATRKLLLHKQEILRLADQIAVKGNAVIPLALYWKNKKIKVKLGVARGKAEFDKREDIKRRDSDRELKRVLMHRLKGR